MPKIRISPQKFSFAERIKKGKVMPVISRQVLAELVLGSHEQLAAGYANYIGYPLPDGNDLLKMAKFKSIYDELDDWELKCDFLAFLTEYFFGMAANAGLEEGALEEAAEQMHTVSVSDFARLIGFPRFDRAERDPLLILADLPLPIYLTTCHHTFVEQALQAVGKKPVIEVCRWHPGLDGIPSVFDGDYEPTDKQPLVYHLHGLDQWPDSLVLTEDDYLAFLVAICQGQDQTDPISSRVRQAVTDSALVFLGFDLPSWDFRVLFWGLIKPAARINRGAFILQLKPSEDEKKYLQAYLKKEARLEIEWKDIHQYTRELRDMLG